MIVFKDMTFCRESCGNEDCLRNYTDEMKKQNEIVDLPVCVADMKTEVCGYIERKDDGE